MKRVSLLFSAFLLIGMLFSAQANAQGRINLNAAKSTQECTNLNDNGFSATFSFSSIDAAAVKTERGTFSNITMENTYPTGMVGEPTLPAANKLIAVPLGVNDLTVEVKSYTTEVYSLSEYGINTLYPQQPLLRKDQDPNSVPFEYRPEAYARQGFVERPIAEVAIKGTMRGIQIGALTVNPVQYDAANNTIRVYNNIVVDVRYGSYDKAEAYNEFARTFSPYFAGIYKTMFNNRQIMDVYDEHPDLWQAPVKMLVIANRAFESTIQDWLNWKTTKGIYVDVNYTDEIGTTSAAIKTFIQNKYATDAPTFLMIMGDKNMVPESATGSATSCVTDLYYMSVDGDEFADIFHSRFPAENQAQMTAMLNKALEYEQLTMPDPSYLSNVLLIAGEDSGWGVTVGRPTIWYATNYYYNTEHGFNNVYEYSHGTYTGCYSNLNTGVGFVNYTAHGSNTSWSGPSFTNSDVNNLTNEHKYFLAMGNCCQAADWGISGTCFGEAMVRAENKAAYAYIGSCPSTYWLNDYYFGVGATSQANGQMPDISVTTTGCYDAMWDNDAFNTVCAIPFIGNLAGNAADALGYTMHISSLYCWQAYHVLGDGSIMPYRVQPTANTISHLPTLPIGMDFYTVSADPGSYVGISKDGILYGAGLIGETGTADIAIEPITSGGDVTICVTHPQRIPSIETVPAAAMTGAYVTVNAYALNVEQVNFDETIDMNIDIKNVGAVAAGNLTATLTTECEYIEILQADGTCAGLEPDEIATMEGFSFHVAGNAPNNTTARFYLTVSDGTDEWESKINIVLHGPDFSVEAIDQTDSEVTFTFKNTGSAPFQGGTFTLTSSSNELSFANPTISFDDVVEPGATINMTTAYSVDPSVPQGTNYEVAYELTTGLYVYSDIYVLTYGSITEDFESGTFGTNWTLSSSHPWVIVDTEAHEGTRCAKSDNHGEHSSEGYMELTVNVMAPGEMTFWYKVSSENNYDKLHFYMDNQEKGVWSGTINWTQFTQEVAVGSHTFKWSYQKDSSVSSGSDCAWVDDIVFPPVNVVTFLEAVTGLEANVDDRDVTLTWEPSENATHYIISRDGEELDIVSETTFADMHVPYGEYEYSVVATNDNGTVSAPATIKVEVIDVYGVEDNTASFKVYPNPTSGTLYINSAIEFTYSLYNSMGQEMKHGNGQGTQQINVSDLSKGVYFLQVTTGSRTNIQKIVVE